jgi:YVTN family beta-propeller protein
VRGCQMFGKQRAESVDNADGKFSGLEVCKKGGFHMRSLRALRIVGIGLAFAAILASGGLPGGSQSGQEGQPLPMISSQGEVVYLPIVTQSGQEEPPPFILAANYADNSVSFIDLIARQVVTNIPVCQGPIGIDVHPSRLYAYVACWDSGAVSVISTAERRGVFGMSLGGNPYSVAFRPDGDVAYVVDGGRNNIVVIDSRNVARPQVLTRISLPAKAARNIDFTPDGLQAYVSDSESGQVWVIDAMEHKLQATLNTGGRCVVGIKVSNFGEWVYGADRCLATVYAIKRETGAITPIPIAEAPGVWHIAFSIDDELAYVTETEPRQNVSSGKISVIDVKNQKVVRKIEVGGLPAKINVIGLVKETDPFYPFSFPIGLVYDPTRSVLVVDLRETPFEQPPVSLITTFGKTPGGVGSCDFLACQDKKEKYDDPFKGMSDEEVKDFIDTIRGSLQEEVKKLEEKEKKGELTKNERHRLNFLRARVQNLKLASGSLGDPNSALTGRKLAGYELATLTMFEAAAALLAKAITAVAGGLPAGFNINQVIKWLNWIKLLATLHKWASKDIKDLINQAIDDANKYKEAEEKKDEKKKKEALDKLKDDLNKLKEKLDKKRKK